MLPWWLRQRLPAMRETQVRSLGQEDPLEKEVEAPCWRPGFNPWVRKISWRRKWQATPVFLPGKSHGWRNLGGHSPWGHKEMDMTEKLHLHFSVFLPGKSRGQKSLAGYGSWSRKELDTTWRQNNNNMAESKSKSYN